MLTDTRSDGNTCHTWALVCPITKAICYAQGGEGHLSENGIYWCHSKWDANVTVSSVLLTPIEENGKKNIDHSKKHFYKTEPNDCLVQSVRNLITLM